jgi:hypothetical protein
VAARLSRNLPGPGNLPGHLAYEADWRVLTALARAILGEAPGAAGEMGKSLDFCRAGGMVLMLADCALDAAESLRACRASEKNPEILVLCLRAAEEACAAARLPHAARRLADLSR